MLDKISKKLIESQIANPKLFLITIAIITIVLAPGLGFIINNVEPSLEKVLPQNVQEVKDLNNMRDQIPSDLIYLTASIEPPLTDITQKESKDFLNTLIERLKTNENIHEAFISDTSKDKSFSVITLQTTTGPETEIIKEALERIDFDITSLESSNPGISFEKTGFTVIDEATFNIILKDFMVITVLSFALVMLIVFFTFRNRRFILPLITVGFSLLWTMGLSGWLQLEFTVISMVAAAMIIGLGIDFGIHVVHTYEDNLKKYHKNLALKKTMHELFRAMIGASTTTIAGFLALLFGVMPAMKTLGIVLAIGIFFTLLGATLLLPTLLALEDRK